jgi:hypothetical protein
MDADFGFRADTLNNPSSDKRRALPVCGQVLASVLALLAGFTADFANASPVFDDSASAASSDFYRKLRAALDALGRSDSLHIRQLHAAVAVAPGTIHFREMTDDPSTWSSDGDPNRGHTNPADRRTKRDGRAAPTDAAVFVPRAALEIGGPRWPSGLLVHELVHALDLASGRYNRDYRVRERRATFMQNVWRSHVGSRLRTSYHGEFATLDYQYAARHGTIAQYAEYIFTRADFPDDLGRLAVRRRTTPWGAPARAGAESR